MALQQQQQQQDTWARPAGVWCPLLQSRWWLRSNEMKGRWSGRREETRCDLSLYNQGQKGEKNRSTLITSGPKLSICFSLSVFVFMAYSCSLLLKSDLQLYMSDLPLVVCVVLIYVYVRVYCIINVHFPSETKIIYMHICIQTFAVLTEVLSVWSSCWVEDDLVLWTSLLEFPFRCNCLNSNHKVSSSLPLQEQTLLGSITILCINSCRRVVRLDCPGHIKDEL